MPTIILFIITLKIDFEYSSHYLPKFVMATLHVPIKQETWLPTIIILFIIISIMLECSSLLAIIFRDCDGHPLLSEIVMATHYIGLTIPLTIALYLYLGSTLCWTLFNYKFT